MISKGIFTTLTPLHRPLANCLLGLLLFAIPAHAVPSNQGMITHSTHRFEQQEGYDVEAIVQPAKSVVQVFGNALTILLLLFAHTFIQTRRGYCHPLAEMVDPLTSHLVYTQTTSSRF